MEGSQKSQQAQIVIKVANKAARRPILTDKKLFDNFPTPVMPKWTKPQRHHSRQPKNCEGNFSRTKLPQNLVINTRTSVVYFKLNFLKVVRFSFNRAADILHFPSSAFAARLVGKSNFKPEIHKAWATKLISSYLHKFMSPTVKSLPTYNWKGNNGTTRWNVILLAFILIRIISCQYLCFLFN